MAAMQSRVCKTCGIEFATPLAWIEAQQQQGGGFFCPNGHHWVFRESEADRLRRERDRLKQQLAYKDDCIREERTRVSAYKGQLTKARNRSKAGLCPCCNRSFEQLARHMKTKHPGFDPAAANVIELKPPKTA